MKERAASSQNGVEIEEQIKLDGHKWHISSVNFSINGVYFASGSWDKKVRIWDLRVLTTSSELGNDENGHTAPITSVSWFPTVEFLLASGSADETVRIWNSESGERLSVLREHTGWVLGTSFNSSGSLLASASWDKTVGIWDINTLKLSQLLQGHTAGVWKAVFRSSQGDNVLCSGSEDSSVKIWDLRAHSKWFQVANLVGIHDDAVKCCAWSPCGNYVAAGSSDCKISVWDIRENRALNILQGHTDMVTDLRFSPTITSKGCQVLASVGDTSSRFWDVLSSQKATQLHAVRQHELDYEVECLELSVDGTLLATGGRDNKIVLSTINIDEAELHKFASSQKCVGGREGGFQRSSRVSIQSSALIVDNAVHQNELLASEKAKKIAKQTVKIKSTGKSDVLQSKLMELKPGKTNPVPLEGKEAEGHSSGLSQSQAKENANPPKARKTAIAIPEKDYDFSDGNQATAQAPGYNDDYKNTDMLYENGLILSSVRNLPQGTKGAQLHSNQGASGLHGSRSTLNSSFDIDDVANELIRLSEEQQSFDEHL